MQVAFMLPTHLPSWLRDWVCLLETEGIVSVQVVYTAASYMQQIGVALKMFTCVTTDAIM